MLINNERIEQRKKELQHFKGFLPSPLDMFVNGIKREEFLKSEGIFEEVFKQEIEYRNTLKSSEDKVDFRLSEFVKWVENNPEFSDFLLEEELVESEDLVLDDSDHKIPTFDIPDE